MANSPSDTPHHHRSHRGAPASHATPLAMASHRTPPAYRPDATA